MVKRGSEPLLTKDEPFQFNEKGRNTRRYGQHTTWFYRYVSNVKKIEDVVYSKSKIYLFCFYVSADYLQILRQPGTSSFITSFKTHWKLNSQTPEFETHEHFGHLEKWKTIAMVLTLQKSC